MNNNENYGPTDEEDVARLIDRILKTHAIYGVNLAITNNKLLKIIQCFTAYGDIDERKLRRAYSEHLAVCTSARGVFLPASKEDRAVFKEYLETKVRTQAIHAAKRLKRLDEAFPEFAPERPAKDTSIQFELDLDKIS